MNLEIAVAVDDKVAMDRVDKLTGKEMRKAILRGNDVAVHLAIDKYRSLLNREEPDWFERRAKGLLKDIRRRARGQRARMQAGGAAGFADSRMRAAGAMELGGRYEQFVKSHRRRQTTWPFLMNDGRSFIIRRLQSPREVTVRDFTRFRTETAKHYLERGTELALPRMAEPTRRALAAVIAEGKTPWAKTLRAGL